MDLLSSDLSYHLSQTVCFSSFPVCWWAELWQKHTGTERHLVLLPVAPETMKTNCSFTISHSFTCLCTTYWPLKTQKVRLVPSRVMENLHNWMGVTVYIMLKWRSVYAPMTVVLITVVSTFWKSRESLALEWREQKEFVFVWFLLHTSSSQFRTFMLFIVGMMVKIQKV